MNTQQPKWKFVTNLGDAHPIDYGGYFIFADETGVYAPEAELLVEPADVDSGSEWKVYRFILEPCTFENGVLSDNKFHPEHPAWFATDLKNAADYCGIPEVDLISSFCSEDPVERAQGWRIVGEYHGFENLDCYPLSLTRAEAIERLKRQGVK